MVMTDTVSVEYRYFTTDLLTNQVLAEIPFRGVSFERSIKAAGSFSGTIPVIPDTSSMDIYNSTMPGKTAIYVVRDGVCIWGGIVWHRSYDVVARSLSVSASEFTSYFHHRDIWKTWSHDFGADLVVSGGTITGTLQSLEYAFPVGSAVKIVFLEVGDFQYNGYYTIATSPNNTTFTITGTSIPNGSYPSATVYARVDTYDFVRQLLDEILVDFSGISFPNTDIEPALATELEIVSVTAPGGVTRITTATAHEIIPTQTIEIYNVNGTLDGLWDVIATPSDTTFTIASSATASVSTITKTVTSKSITDYVATLTTSTSHGFTAGKYVTLSGVDDPAAFLNVFNGKQYIVATPTATTFTIYVSDSDMPITDTSGDGATNRSVRVATTANITTTGYYTNTGYFGQYISSVLVTSSTTAPVIDGVTLSEGDRVLIKDQATPAHNGIYTYQRIVRHINNSFNDTQEGGGYTGTYNAGRRLGQGTFYWNVNDSITVNGGTNPISALIGINFGSYPYLQNISSQVWTGFIRASDSDTMAEIVGSIVIASSGTLNSQKVFLSANGSGDVLGTTAISYSKRGGTAVVQPTVKYGTYGPFPGNSDIDIQYSTDAYSGKNVPNTNYRGYELKSAGEELDAYSDTVDGFEYRIDCDLVYVGDIPTFTRTFVLIAIDYPNPPAAGEVSPPSRYGADQLVFEYPGSIINVTMEENAENAATRFFVVGNIPDLGSDISQPYAVATATDMLLNGWPILDANETRSEVEDEELLYSHAERYLTEARPPISDIKVRVNGSLSPVIGEYVPGDWCSIIVEDEFIRMRLASDLEVRDTVIVRKIDGYKVTVPDTPSFGEEVELTLVTEAQVDKRGQ